MIHMNFGIYCNNLNKQNLEALTSVIKSLDRQKLNYSLNENLAIQAGMSSALSYKNKEDLLKKADLYYDWAYQLLVAKPETGLLTADTLEQLALKAESKLNLSRAAYLRGYAYGLLGKFEEALPQHRKELNLAM